MSSRPSFRAIMQGCALFLDIDGTLLEFSSSPSAVVIPPDLPALLEHLQHQLDGALALISGRSLPDIEAMFGKHIAIGAEHGALVRSADGGVITQAVPDPALARITPKLRQIVATSAGLLLEEKHYGLTLHWRAAPALAQTMTCFVEGLVAPYKGLVLLPAHQALEIRTLGTDKATALQTFMAIHPFAGRRPIFIGDDVTDEPAIAHATALHGVGLHVGRDFGNSPQEVRAWLAEGVDNASPT